MQIAPLDCVIDVSHDQGIVDWGAVFGAGIQVAMIKATQGRNFTDPRWLSNQAGALAAGLKIIPYHFVDTSDPGVQAANFSRHCEAGKAFALDWEGRSNLAPAGVEQLGTILSSKLGRAPLGYWGIAGSTPAVPTAAMTAWPRWVPRYRFGAAPSFPASSETAGEPCLFWQYSANGSVPGIRGSVDRSVAMFGSIAELLAWCDAPPASAALQAA